MAHQNVNKQLQNGGGGGAGAGGGSAGHWWSKPSTEEPFKIQELNEDIYGDFMLRGLKIANQR